MIDNIEDIDYSDIEFIEFDIEVETEQPINPLWHLIANEI